MITLIYDGYVTVYLDPNIHAQPAGFDIDQYLLRGKEYYISNQPTRIITEGINKDDKIGKVFNVPTGDMGGLVFAIAISPNGIVRYRKYDVDYQSDMKLDMTAELVERTISPPLTDNDTYVQYTEHMYTLYISMFKEKITMLPVRPTHLQACEQLEYYLSNYRPLRATRWTAKLSDLYDRLEGKVDKVVWTRADILDTGIEVQLLTVDDIVKVI